MKTDAQNDTPLIHHGETADEILNGRIKVIQRKRGYRFSLDALLLAHFIGPGKSCHLLDLGTGSGIISLILAYLRPGIRIVGIEIQTALADMAMRTLALNGLQDTINIIVGDIRKLADLIPAHASDVVVANPPYRRLHSGRINPESEKAQARHELSGSLDDFLTAAMYALKPGGRLYLIYPARRMTTLICQMRQNRLELKRCRLVYSHPESRGEFILAEGVADGREELTKTATADFLGHNPLQNLFQLLIGNYGQAFFDDPLIPRLQGRNNERT